MVTKLLRVLVACSGVMLAAFAVGGCIAQSPVVGKEDGASAPEERRGTVDRVGTANYVVKTILADSIPAGLYGTCLARKVPVDADGTVPCNVFSVRQLGFSGECRCEGSSRAVPNPAARAAVEAELELQGLCQPNTSLDCSSYCVCEELPATGADLDGCRNEQDLTAAGSGWCYIEGGRGAARIDVCPETQQQMLRLVSVEPRTLYFVMCSSGPVPIGTTEPGPGALGSACLPSDERDAQFSGFGLMEVSVEFGSPDCESNICLVNHFIGRVSCPYGQSPLQGPDGPLCFLPGSDAPVDVPVDPELVQRQAHLAVTCSCRCDGPDLDASYCECPSGMECAPLIRQVGLPGDEAYAGSYCIPNGTRFDPTHPPSPDSCDPTKSHLYCGDPRPY